MSCCEIVFAAHLGTLKNFSSCKHKNSEMGVQFLLNFKAETKLLTFQRFWLLKSTTIVCVCRNAIPQISPGCQFSEMLICWMVGVFLRNENNRGWLCEIFANEKIEISVSFVNFEKACKILNYKNLLDLWRLWKCKTLPNEFKSGKMKCFSSMEKDNQIKLKISVWELEKDPRWSPMVLGDFVFVKEGRGDSRMWTPILNGWLQLTIITIHNVISWMICVCRELCVCFNDANMMFEYFLKVSADFVEYRDGWLCYRVSSQQCFKASLFPIEMWW